MAKITFIYVDIYIFVASRDVDPTGFCGRYVGWFIDFAIFCRCFFFRLNHLSSIVAGFLPQTMGFPIYFLVRTVFWRWRRRLVGRRNCNILKYSFWLIGVPLFRVKQTKKKNSQLLSLGSSFVLIWKRSSRPSYARRSIEKW